MASRDDDFDVIVVGAGAAGAPLAARLSEDPQRRVLLLEAGPDCRRVDDFPAELLDARLLAGARPGHPNNWAFVAALTPEITYTVARGKILGGSTALNGTYFIRPRRLDLDRWAALGNPAWSYEAVLPSLRRLENDRQYGESPVHGNAGPIPVTRHTPLHPVTEAFFGACAELGFSEETDKNADARPGYGLLPVNAVDGVRVNTGIAYVIPARQRPNLTVRGDAFVRRVLLNGRRAVGVEVHVAGSSKVIRADEVVLCAGAIKSPHLLALSGIGPSAELERAGIDVVHDLSGVGKGFSDHPDVMLNWTPRRNFDQPGQSFAFQGVLNWTAPGSSHDGDLEILPQLRSLGASLGLRPRLEDLRRLIPTMRALRGVSKRMLARQLAHRNDLFFAVSLQQADSRGEITTVSADPSVPPAIEHRYLSEESDQRRMREAIRTAAAILQTRAFERCFSRLTEIDDRTLDDDARLDEWLRTHMATAIHTCGSCRMGSDPEQGAVVDQFGRVHGIDGLRVADTSIVPFAPSRGPAATAVMIGERIAELMH